MSWRDSSDVLEGIMVGHDGSHLHSDLSNLRPSGLALGDSASNPLLELHLSADLPPLEAQNQPAFLNQWSSTDPQDFYYAHYPSSRLMGDQDAWNPLQVTGVPNPSSMSYMNVSAPGDPDCGFPKPHYSTPSESGSQCMGSFHSADSGYGSTCCATHSVIPSSYGMDVMSSPPIAAKDHGFGEPVALCDQAYVGSGSVFSKGNDYSPSYSPDGSVKCDHPSCSWVGKCPSDKRYLFIFPRHCHMGESLILVGNMRHATGKSSNVMNPTALGKKGSALLMTSPATRNAFTTNNPSVGRK